MISTKNRIMKYFDERPELIEKRRLENHIKIADFIEEHQQKILKDFQDTFNTIFQRGIAMQEVEEKGPIEYVSISILRSSMFTQTRRLRIDLYDENAYYDSHECGGMLNVDFVFQWLNEDMTYFTKCAREKLIRIQEAEMMMFMQYYLENYYDVLEEFCAKHIEKIVQLKSWTEIKKKEKVNFTYGEYMDKLTILKVVDKIESKRGVKNE